MRPATLVTTDRATGLRRGPIRWPDGTVPTPFGCRRCGYPESWHGIGAHQWERPTKAQMLARMKARRAARLAPKVVPVADPSTLVTLTFDTGPALETIRTVLHRLGPPCIPDHGSGGWCPGCAYNPES